MHAHAPPHHPPTKQDLRCWDPTVKLNSLMMGDWLVCCSWSHPLKLVCTMTSLWFSVELHYLSRTYSWIIQTAWSVTSTNWDLWNVCGWLITHNTPLYMACQPYVHEGATNITKMDFLVWHLYSEIPKMWRYDLIKLIWRGLSQRYEATWPGRCRLAQLQGLFFTLENQCRDRENMQHLYRKTPGPSIVNHLLPYWPVDHHAAVDPLVGA